MVINLIVRKIEKIQSVLKRKEKKQYVLGKLIKVEHY